MDYHPFKAVLNRYFSRHVGGERRPVFFDIDATFPALNAITRHYATIRAECERILSARGTSMPAYHEIDPGEAPISLADGADKRWSVFMLYILGHQPSRNRMLCPETCRILDGIPGLVQAFFSVLDPGKSVPRHHGPYLGYLRYHLGLCVPKAHPPCLIVNGQSYVWSAGEAVLFDDTWPHEVINHGQDARAVLIVDVFRPMPFWPALLNRTVARAIIGPTYGRAVARRAGAFAT